MPENSNPNLYSEKVIEQILNTGKPKEVKSTSTTTAEGGEGVDFATAIMNALFMYMMMNQAKQQQAAYGSAPAGVGQGMMGGLGSMMMGNPYLQNPTYGFGSSGSQGVQQPMTMGDLMSLLG